jgi:hypothetical protein
MASTSKFFSKGTTRQAAQTTGPWNTDGEHLILQDALIVDDFYGDLSPSYAQPKHGATGLPIDSTFAEITLRVSANGEYRYQKQKR